MIERIGDTILFGFPCNEGFVLVEKHFSTLYSETVGHGRFRSISSVEPDGLASRPQTTSYPFKPNQR